MLNIENIYTIEGLRILQKCLVDTFKEVKFERMSRVKDKKSQKNGPIKVSFFLIKQFPFSLTVNSV